ncbi:cytochrome P460 family protein [Puia sp. P3]|uniref:cytochrome P460 family protein n=1 Tax=Puia sp. P3 TaxID=3423952 RepID=UPI003D672D26
MPLSQYTAFHHGGKVSPEEVALFRQYLLSLTPRAVPDTVKQRASVEQYEKWIVDAIGKRGDILDEYNGVGYADLAGFRDWTAVSTTERFDNGTMRLILGNSVVERAIREGHTNPWPKGAVFAKVAWDHAAGFCRGDTYRRIQTGGVHDPGWSEIFDYRWLGLGPLGRRAGNEALWS